MIHQCVECEKIRRFGEWIDVPVDLIGIFADLKKNRRVIEITCPICDKGETHGRKTIHSS